LGDAVPQQFSQQLHHHDSTNIMSSPAKTKEFATRNKAIPHNDVQTVSFQGRGFYFEMTAYFRNLPFTLTGYSNSD
jgi:hypothetical protein